MFRQFFKSIVDRIIYALCRNYAALPRAEKTLLLFRKDGMGDYIIFYPYLKYIAQHFSGYKITLVVATAGLGLEPILKEYVEILPFDTKKFSGSVGYRYSFIKAISKAGFELASYPVFSRESIGDMIMELTGSASKSSFKLDASSHRIYDDLIPLPSRDMSEIDRNREFSKHFESSTPNQLTFPTIDVKKFDSHEAEELSKKHTLSSKTYCIIFPGTGAEYKRWPEERFAAVCDHLIAKGIRPIICGAPSDTERAEMIIARCIQKEGLLNLTGTTSIPALAYLLKHSLFYFGNDTGAVHLAAALDVPAVCIMGGGHFGRFFPYGTLDRNRIIYDPDTTCKNDEWKCAEGLPKGTAAPCIESITTAQAIKQIDDLILYLKKCSTSDIEKK